MRRMGVLTLEIWQDSEVLQRCCSHLLQWILPISVAQNILNGKYFGRIAGFPVSSPLLYLPTVVCGSLDQMLSLLDCCSTWKSRFLGVPQKPLLPAIKWLKLTYFSLYFEAHQIWTSLYLLQSSSHDLQSHQHLATKDSIRLKPLGARLTPHTNEPQERPCPWPSWSQALPLQCPAEVQESPWTTAPCWQLSLGATGKGHSQCHPLPPPDMAEARNSTRLKLSIWSGARADNKRQSQGTRLTETSCQELDCISNRMWTLTIQLGPSVGFWLSKYWRFENHCLLLSEKRRPEGTLAVKATGRCRRGDPAILTQSLPEVSLRLLAASSLGFVCFVLDMAPVPGHFTTLHKPAWTWGREMPQLSHCCTPGMMFPSIPPYLAPRACHSQATVQQFLRKQMQTQPLTQFHLPGGMPLVHQAGLCPCPVCNH